MAVFCEPGCGCKRHSWQKPPGFNERVAAGRQAALAKEQARIMRNLERRLKRRVEAMQAKKEEA